MPGVGWDPRPPTPKLSENFVSILKDGGRECLTLSPTFSFWMDFASVWTTFSPCLAGRECLRMSVTLEDQCKQ